MRIRTAALSFGSAPDISFHYQYGDRMMWSECPMPGDLVGIYVAKKGRQQPSRKLTPAQSRLRKRSIFKAR